MMTSRPVCDDEFYIGYGGGMPPGIRRRVRAAVLAAACIASVAAATVVIASATLPTSRFEFGVVTELTGVVRRVPYPVLETGGGRVWLVGRGKSGADRMLSGIFGGPVTVRGSRIKRQRHEMLEVASIDSGATGSTSDLSHEAHGKHPNDAGAIAITLRGEIVDSKCFLGVMNPAEGAVHRDCARRCLSGGIPPMLLVRDGEFREELLLLVSADGRAISRETAPAAGTPVEVTGGLVLDGSDYVLYVAKWSRL